MKKTGEILKKAREEKGLSLNEIGLSLKINSKVLKAIEEGDDAHLPAKTFLRGFVQSYANFLHLDSDKVLEVFYEEMGSTKPKPYIRPTESDKSATLITENAPGAGAATATGSEPQENKTEASVTPIRRTPPPSSKSDGMESLRENKTTKTVAIISVGVVLVGLILFTKKMIDKYSKEAEVPSSEVAQTMEGATPVTAETPQLTEVETSAATTTESPLGSLTTPAATVPATLPSPTPAASPAVSTPAKPIATASPTPAVSPSPSPTPVATAKPTPTPAVSPSPTATPVASPSPTPTPTPKESNKPVELIVEALDTVEIEYAAPNGKPQKIRLSAEQVHTFKSKSGLKINFSNGGAVNLIHNGKEVGIPGDLGKPIKLSY
ncbi:helix-turn-helix domain-containing protein [Bdellovibrio sp. 22V]|uniref:helix-turn-helix domain-containing protein n=1 Tax=Bdellovibrio TaxID=958 RepID=UPI002543EC83|nr:helix-turn-helix domain-containing protein [Bdellovibrio sp. 22V]WII72757.1 helix-turn-helix domain-containing protein [Bdellovibrio sp. 22V]